MLLVLGAVGIAAVAAAVLIVVAATGGGSDSAATTTTAQKSAPSSSLAGIPQRGDTLGDASAPATLVVYEDPQCPFCRRWNVETLPTVLRDQVRPGRLKLQYRGVVIIGPNSLPGLRAIYAAGKQNKLWNMVDALYTHQGDENSGWITTDVIRQAAREAGAGADEVVAGMNTAATTAALTRSAKQAVVDRVPGTPTFIVERPPALARPLSLTGLDPASFEAALSAALQQ